MPAPDQALRHRLQGGEVALDMPRIKPRHHHAALAPPGVAIGGKHAERQTHFDTDGFEAGRAAQAVGPITQERSHHLMVTDHQHLAIANLQLEQESVLAAPLFELLVKPQRFDLQCIAQQWNAARARQFVIVAQNVRRLCHEFVRYVGLHDGLAFLRGSSSVGPCPKPRAGPGRLRRIN